MRLLSVIILPCRKQFMGVKAGPFAAKRSILKLSKCGATEG